MKKEVLLTVVVPVFNGEKYIRDTVGYIAGSTYSDLEILLIDDGSLDGSSKICRSLQEEDARIRCISMSNSGIAAARNKGLELASGKYVCFCDQDDETQPKMYENIIAKMEKEKADIGMCSTGRDIDGKRSIYESLQDGCYEGNRILTGLLYPLLFRGYEYPFIEGQHYLYGSVWKCIFKREMLRKAEITFRSFIDFEDDWLFLTQALAKADKVVTVSSLGYYWKVHKTSRSHTHRFIDAMPERLRLLDAWEDSYLGCGRIPESVFREYEKVRFCGHYVWLIENGLPNESRNDRAVCYEQVKKYFLQSGYRNQLSAVNHLKKNALKRRLVLLSIRHFGIRMAFFTSSVLDILIQRAEKLSWLVRWERRSKTGEKEIER